ncbi:MAG: fused response regulator/phosphatase [Rickettsiales bacterium]|jgi:sigma-B regulation protein RsbU (phosphoserine phosphatase)|nr:fused response regulator/phosphatase [Rickettsiales bacterium]
MALEKNISQSTILIVDDIELNRKLLETTLRKGGYTNILSACNGEEALKLTCEHLPDLVILDIMMPTMDGYAYCTAIRQDSKYSNMPIIIQTVLDEMDKKLLAFKLGATDYICKPVEPLELLARTQVHLSQKMLIENLKKHHERIETELELARKTQLRLLPSSKQIHLCEHMFNMKIASHFQPSSELGGDAWGMQPLSETRLAIWMYDFSGHGMLAAMNVFRMHTLMQECMQYASDPGQFLTHLNKRLHKLLDSHEFATMFYGIIDTEANCLIYSSAATTAPLLYSPNGSDIHLNNMGFPLGAVTHAIYESRFAAFAPDDILLLHSDGLTESLSPEGHFITEDDLMNCLKQRHNQNETNLAKTVNDDICSMLNKDRTSAVDDDVTISIYHRLKN